MENWERWRSRVYLGLLLSDKVKVTGIETRHEVRGSDYPGVFGGTVWIG